MVIIGRNKLEVKRDINLQVRLCPEEKEKLEYLSKKYNLSYRELFIRVVNFIYEFEKK